MRGMPNILLVKMSSMGDLIHALPTITDIRHHFPDATIDWVAEEAFIDIPRLHPGIRRVLPVAIRRWRRKLWVPSVRREIRDFLEQLQADRYDLVIDAQGLLKSAWVTRHARGPSCCFDRRSIREKWALPFYDKTFPVRAEAHAIDRNRELAGFALGYTPEGETDYGIHGGLARPDWAPVGPYATLVHGTSRDSKLWPEPQWIELGKALSAQGMAFVLPWGNAAERQRAHRLADAIPNAIAAPKLNLAEAAALLANGRLTVGVDTGLSHLSCAVDTPTIGLYCDTAPERVGLVAPKAVNLGGPGMAPSVADVLDTAARMAAHG